MVRALCCENKIVKIVRQFPVLMFIITFRALIRSLFGLFSVAACLNRGLSCALCFASIAIRIRRVCNFTSRLRQRLDWNRVFIMNTGTKFFSLFKMPAFLYSFLARFSIFGFQVKHYGSSVLPLVFQWLSSVFQLCKLTRNRGYQVAFQCTLGSKFQAHWIATGLPLITTGSG